jgi:thiosulfate/3-mercaptopyruvate sulfurtransferase
MLSNILRRRFSFVPKNKALIEISELVNIIGDSNTSIIHACMSQPNYDIKKAHITARIPNSVYFSINDICDKSNPVPLMLPAEEDFVNHMSALDIRLSDTIVCYDSINMLAAPRASWMLRAFGSKNVYVLNGTFLKWIEL